MSRARDFRPVQCYGSLPNGPTILSRPGDVSVNGNTTNEEALSDLGTPSAVLFPSNVPNLETADFRPPLKQLRELYASECVLNKFSRMETSTPCAVYWDVIGRRPSLRPRSSDLFVHCLISSMRSAHGSVSQLQSEGTRIAHEQQATRNPGEQLDPNYQVKRVTPTWVAGWSVVNLIQGIGILGIPYACMCAGWASLPIIIGVAVLCCFTGKLLGETMYRYPEQQCGDYFRSPYQLANRVHIHRTIASVADELFPKFGYCFANMIAITELFGASVLYMILLGQSASALFGPIMTYAWSVTYWTVIMTGICVPLLLYPQMRAIAWFSGVALIGLFGSIILVLAYCAMDLAGRKHVWTNLPHPTLSQLPFGAGELPVRSDEFAVTAIHFGSAQNDSGRMETVMSLGDQSTGYNYSRSQGGTRGQSLLSQTWKSGLHHLPALSFVSSLTSAYSIIDRRRGDESSLTAEVEEEEGEQVSRGSEGGDGDREVLPLLAESGEVRQWSVYNNACRTTSVWVSGWNVTNLVQGVGVLAVPYACFQAGWMCLPIVILIAAIACYTGHMVGECLYDNPRITITGYRELHRTRVRSTMSCIAAHAIPRGGQHFTGALVLLDMFGAAILYLLLLGRSSAEIFGPLLHVEWPLSYWIVVEKPRGPCEPFGLMLVFDGFRRNVYS
ncbi:hypothetical protein FGIG_00463 [Fasciola gigantica]|uniref:Amino acid transporter transmembrane domain-containing protein n=1 Tax=Fasciola gigantica TaxID=46835 RepID=A0A504YZZ2_FASGI|nr:hypothetical protein FGIG_00463 [Fasciola gigantica]